MEHSGGRPVELGNRCVVKSHAPRLTQIARSLQTFLLILTCSVENLRPQPWRAYGTRDAPTAAVERRDTGYKSRRVAEFV